MADFLTVRHEFADFDTWKAVYDEDAPNRAAAGLSDLVLARAHENPNLIGLIFGVSDREKAMAFGKSDALREKMMSAGIVGAPVIALREGNFTPPSGHGTLLTINCTISGIDKFRAGYAMDVDDRVAAGLTDLGVLTAVNDPANLFLIWSVGNVASAEAFMAKPELAKHQVENAGVTSAPVMRFWEG